MFIRNKENTDYTDLVKLTYKIITNRFGHSARITDIWSLLRVSYDLDEFQLINQKLYMNGSFEAYLIDQQVDWLAGKDVNFTEIYDAILQVGDFTGSEKLLFESGNIEERLWAILLAVVDPEMNI